MNIFWLLFVLVTISLSSIYHWYIFVVVLFGWGAGIFLTGCSPKKVIRRFLKIEPFFLLMAVFSFFQDQSGILFINILCKASLSLLWILFFSEVVSLPEVIRNLKRAKTPHVLIETISLTIRYITVIIDEFKRVERARKSRFSSVGRRANWTILSYMIARLYHRSSLRAHRVYQAFVCRGMI